MTRVPPAQPDGDVAPEDGLLPDEAWAEFGRKPFGLYVHVPFCAVRCGYCDFNTYTAHELGDEVGASRSSYAEAAIARDPASPARCSATATSGSRRSSSAAAPRPC